MFKTCVEYGLGHLRGHVDDENDYPVSSLQSSQQQTSGGDFTAVTTETKGHRLKLDQKIEHES